MISRVLILFSAIVVLVSCKEEVMPKPKAMLRLQYPEGNYNTFNTQKFEFLKNEIATVKQEKQSGLILDYPMMKGSLYLTYKPINGNLNQLLTDAQRLSYEHVIKADNIVEQPFLNPEDGVYGMFYEVTGNAASQSQFYVTDSTNHFLTGSLYFYAKPNYDSIYPAAIYLQKDIRRVMESLKWK